MNAKDFFENFTSQIYQEHNIIEDYWSPCTTFTKVVTRVINKIIESNGYEKSNEYFRIDVTGWESSVMDISDEAKRVDMNPHLWKLKIAVEHENNKKDWADEVIKLLHIRCPLKVVIAYNDYKNRAPNAKEDNPRSDENKLSVVSGWMERTLLTEALQSTKTSEEFLVILGNAVHNPDEHVPAKSFDYRGYLYNYQRKTFERI